MKNALFILIDIKDYIQKTVFFLKQVFIKLFSIIFLSRRETRVQYVQKEKNKTKKNKNSQHRTKMIRSIPSS